MQVHTYICLCHQAV